MTLSARLWASVAAAASLVAAGLAYLLNRPKRVGHALIVTAPEHTIHDPQCGVRSVQEADLILPTPEVEKIWNPRHLERLARTYWRFLTRATLGMIRIRAKNAAQALEGILQRAFARTAPHAARPRLESGWGAEVESEIDRLFGGL